MNQVEASRNAGDRAEPLGVVAALGSLSSSRPRVEHAALAAVVFGGASYIAAWAIARAEVEAIVGLPLEDVRYAAGLFDVARGAACIAILSGAAWVMNLATQARATVLVVCGLFALLQLIADATTGRASVFALVLSLAIAGAVGALMAGRDAVCETAGLRPLLRRVPLGEKAGESDSRAEAWIFRTLQYMVVAWAILFLAVDAVRLRADAGPKVSITLRSVDRGYRADGTRDSGPGREGGILCRSDPRGVFIGQRWRSGGTWYPRSNVEDVYRSRR
jgi:hypothetical protein